jgi:hypothetical protein
MDQSRMIAQSSNLHAVSGSVKFYTASADHDGTENTVLQGLGVAEQVECSDGDFIELKSPLKRFRVRRADGSFIK